MSNYCKNCYELTEELENHKRWLNDYKQKLQDAEEFANAKITQCANLIKQLNEVHDQLDELKVKNDELKENLKDFQDDCKGCSTCHEALYNANLYAKENIKLKQVLTEIKEIATCCIEGDVARIRMKQILEKISEVEND